MATIDRRSGSFNNQSQPSKFFAGGLNVSRCGKQFLSFLLLAATFFLVSAAHAQYRTSIQGTVTDPSGAVVSDDTVTLTNKETNQTLEAPTSSAGVYNFNALPPSNYTISVEK